MPNKQKINKILKIKILIKMDASRCEFLAEQSKVDIIPNFNERALHLISGDFGPFEAGLSTSVPLWLALSFKEVFMIFWRPNYNSKIPIIFSVDSAE